MAKPCCKTTSAWLKGTSRTAPDSSRLPFAIINLIPGLESNVRNLVHLSCADIQDGSEHSQLNNAPEQMWWVCGGAMGLLDYRDQASQADCRILGCSSCLNVSVLLYSALKSFAIRPELLVAQEICSFLPVFTPFIIPLFQLSHAFQLFLLCL